MASSMPMRSFRLLQEAASCAATALSLANVYYVGRRTLGTDQARVGVRAYLTAFDVLPVDAGTLSDADALPGGDFEDNIQIAAALRAHVDVIVTRDEAGFIHSTVPILAPDIFLQRL